MTEIERSYGKIGEQNKLLGFQMVNPDGEEFFIYADPLINVYRNISKQSKSRNFVRIKKRDRDPKQSRGYHQGEIWAKAIEMHNPRREPKKYFKIKLYFGPAAKKMTLNETGTEFIGLVAKQTYNFPKDEFRCFVKAIEAMYTQHTSYTLMKMGAEVYIDRDLDLL